MNRQRAVSSFNCWYAPYSDAVVSQVVAVVWLLDLLLQQCEHSVSRRSYMYRSWVCVDLHGMVEVCVCNMQREEVVKTGVGGK